MPIIPTGPFSKVPLWQSVAPPSNLPLQFSNLEEYYDSRGLGLAHGANVTPWADLSGHSPNRDMVDDPGPTIPPTYLSASGLSPKGRELVRWDGIGGITGMLLTTGTINPFPPATRGHTFYAYANWRATGAPPAPFPGSTLWGTSLFNSCPRELINQANGTNLLQWRDNGGFHGTHAFVTGFHQLAWVFDPVSGNGKIYIDGVLVDTIAFTFGANAADTTALSFNVNVPLNADQGHFVWFSNVHTDAQVAIFSNWARFYWGY